jgi:hypothetical protein
VRVGGKTEERATVEQANDLERRYNRRTISRFKELWELIDESSQSEFQMNECRLKSTVIIEL